MQVIDKVTRESVTLGDLVVERAIMNRDRATREVMHVMRHEEIGRASCRERVSIAV